MTLHRLKLFGHAPELRHARPSCLIAKATLAALAMSLAASGAQAELWIQPVVHPDGVQIRMAESQTLFDPSQGRWVLRGQLFVVNTGAATTSVTASFEVPGYAFAPNPQPVNWGGSAAACTQPSASAVSISLAQLGPDSLSNGCEFVLLSNGAGGAEDLPEEGEPSEVQVATDTGNFIAQRPLNTHPSLDDVICRFYLRESVYVLPTCVPAVVVGVRRRRASGRRGRGGIRRLLGISCLLAGLLVVPSVIANGPGTAVLEVDPDASSLIAILDAIDMPVEPLSPEGSMNVALSLAEDPLLGVVVDQFEATGGSLDLGAPSFTASFPPHVAISTAATNWFLNPDSAPVAPVATAPNRSEIPLAAFGLRLMAGIFTATGTALGQAVATAYDFSLVEPATLFAGEPVVLETSPAPGGGTNLTLSMSFDSVTLAIPSPMMAPLILRGDLVLTGAVPTALPAFSGTALRAVQVLLLVAGALLVSWPRQRPGQPGALANAPARYRWGRALSLRRLRGR